MKQYDAKKLGARFDSALREVCDAMYPGPLAYVQTGDRIRLSVSERSLEWLVSPEELARRQQAHPVTPPTAARGYKQLFLKSVNQADQGADFDFLRAEQSQGKTPR